MASSEIHSVQSVSGNQPRVRRIIEAITQTFLSGVPVQLDGTSGGVEEWDGTTIAYGIAGFSKEPGNNLTTLGTPKQVTQGSVPNQPSAQNIQRPFFNDGLLGFEVATEDTVFRGQVSPAQTALASDVGKQYGMTKDADNHWFVDKAKVTVGTNTVARVTKLDPNDQSATPRGIYFVINAANAQVVA